MTRVPPIAVVALSALLPGAPDTGGFWRAVVAGTDQVTEVPATHWLAGDHYDPDPAAPDRAYTTRGAFLPPVVFDPLAYGIPPRDLSATDTSQLLALIVADRLLGGLAAGRPVAADRERTAVVLGTSALKLLTEMAGRIQRPVWLKALREHGMPEDEALAVCDTIAAQYAPWREATLPGLLSNVVAGRIANRFDLHGGNYTADAACASSLAALSGAVGQLALGQADLVVTGGVDTLNDPVMYTSFSKTPALSPTGDCRPFSDRADGMVLGEGVVMFALKRLADAERDGDHVHAVVRGIGMSSDGHGTAIYAPLPEGQVRALRRAYEAAGYGPGTVELIEAHGTGTAAGDAAEIAALRTVFEEAEVEGHRGRQWCALGSVKSQIGHTKNAAGAAGLLKAVLAVEHKVLPPTIKVTRPNPALGLDDSPFHLNTEARPWISARPHPRRAGVSSFGFGGTNFHVTVEEYVPGAHAGGDAPGEHGSRPAGKRGPRPAGEHADRRPGRLIRTSATELVPLAADSADALLEKCASLRADPRPLVGVARAAQRDFRPTAPVRLAVVARTRDDLNEKLATAAERIGADPAAAFTDPRGVHYGASAPLTGRVAFLFPGQGGQYPGMGAAVAIAYPQARQEWDRAARALAGPPGDGGPGPDESAGAPDDLDRLDDLPRVVFPPPAFDDAVRERQAAELERTEWAQPALAAHSLALAAVLRAAGLRPDAVAGHSFGELVALHLAGCYDAPALVRLARRRGELMRDAATAPGAMTAVFAPPEQVGALLDALNHGEGADGEGADGDDGDGGTRAPELWVANHNAPDQVVVAGTRPAIERLEAGLTAASVRWTRLRTATAFHSPVVAGAVPALRAFLDGLDVRPPALDVYANASADRYPADAGPDAVRDRVAGHLTSPVRFAEQIRAMHDDGVRVFVEVGAGDTLTGLTGRVLAGREHLAVSLDRRGAEGTAALHDGLARLAVHGIALEFDELWAPFAPAEETSMQTSPSAASVELTGANHGRPYPPPGGAAALPPPNPPRPAQVPDPAPQVPAQVPVPGSGTSPTVAPAPYGTAPGQAGSATAPGPGTPFPGAVAGPAAGYAPTAGHAPVATGRTPAAPVPQDRWSAALREAHQQVSAAHVTYQRVTAEAHMAFLRMSEAALTGHQPVTVPPAGPAPAPYASPPAGPAPAPYASPHAASGPYAAAEPFAHPSAPAGPPLPETFVPVPQAVVPPPAPEAYAPEPGYAAGPYDHAPQPFQPAPAAPAPAAYAPAPEPEADQPYGPAASPAPAEPAGPGEGPGGLPDEAAVLGIVADRTGYPEEVLDADMDLAADLGVDSIKRVEILSALRSRYPGLPDLDSRTAHQARTVRQVVAAFAPATAGAPATAADGPAQGGRGGATESSTEGPAPPAPAPAPDTQQRPATEPTPADAAHAERLPAASDTATTGLFRLAVRAVPAAAPGLALPGLIGSRVAVTDDGTGVARALLPLLHEAGVRAFLARDITDITGITSAVGLAETSGNGNVDGADGVIVLDGLGALDASAAVRRAFRAARALAPRPAAREGVFVTVQDTGGDFGLSGAVPGRAVTGALAGLARTVGAEWPRVSAKAVDCARDGRPAADVARDIARELLTGGAVPDAGLAADGTRRVLIHAEAPLTGPASSAAVSTGPVSTRSTGPVSTGPVRTAAVPTGASPLDPDSVVVVTGGARGVTAAVVRALAETYGCRIVLLGRTEPADAPEPEEVRRATGEAELRRAVTARLRASGEATPRRIRAEAAAILAAREIRATVAGAEAAGARVRYLALDVRDRAALETALAGVRREWGPVTALVHGAGVLADSRIEDKDDEAFDRVFDTKVEGLRNLLAATAGDPLRVLCVFSSVAAVYGNPGQSDYAMANEAVTQMALAEAARRPGCLVRAIAWGPWDGGMVDGTLAGRFRAAGVPLIPVREGARACLAELRAQGGDVPVVLAAGPPAPAPGAGGGRAGRAGGAEGAGELPGLGGEVLVTRAAHPYLADHEIGGVPVLPAAMALEWFTALAGPDRTVTDLRVLSKVALTGFHTDGRDSGEGDGGDLLRLTETEPGPANAPARTDAPGGPRPGAILELRYDGPDGHGKAVPNYRARAVPAGRTPPPAPAGRAAPPAPPPYEGTVYDGHTLFHGPAFQCLREVGGLSAAAGATGTVEGLRAAGWPGGPWHTDPLAVDGALQLATLWAREVLGGAALPMGVGAFVWHRPGPLDGPASLRVRPGPVGPAEAECDVELSAPDGTPVAVLTGVRLVARPR
ncbi:SDR family NAD(P)-dependent oxidoreductase [Streptomyces sp. NPDC013433]|uniref:SDR family NAD(P)-dependent oxidoreductase n=1 Tax=Streptomyces sp. NPDC013433 TaxID=3155604 RepID=UPI0034546BC8